RATHSCCIDPCCFFQAEDGIRDGHVTGVQTCALPISIFTTGTRLRKVTATPATSTPPGTSAISTIPTCWPDSTRTTSLTATSMRSEERRVGKECRNRCGTPHYKQTNRYEADGNETHQK